MRAYLFAVTAALITFAWSGVRPSASADDDYRLLEKIELPSRALSVAVNPDTNRLYVTLGYELRVMDATTHELLATLPVQGTSAMAVNRATNTLYAVDYQGHLSVVDGETHEVADVIIAPGANAIAVNEVSNQIYVNGDYELTYVIDGTTNTQIAQFPPKAANLALDPKAGRAYTIPGYPPRTSHRLSITETETFHLLGGVNIGLHPFDVVADPGLGRVFVAVGINDSVGPGQILVVEPESRSILKKTPLETQIVALGIDAQSHIVYAVSFYTNSVTLLDSEGVILGSVSVGQGPNKIAVDEVRHVAYVANSNESTIAVVGSGSSALPGLGGRPAERSGGTTFYITAGIALLILGTALLSRAQGRPAV